MKIAARLPLCAAVLLFVAAPLFAQNSGPSASGGFHFSAGEHPLNIEFHARTDKNGATDGKIRLSGTVDMPDQDVDGEGLFSSASLTNVSLEISVDCLAISRNTAAMSGEITDSNIPALVGNRGLLAVVDNGEGAKGTPDQFMWGVYGTPDLTWVASDAELELDPGVGLTWIATDFEREDDLGVPSHQSTAVDCHSFSGDDYTFVDLGKGSGNIQVKP
jgi:hypothetical protein